MRPTEFLTSENKGSCSFCVNDKYGGRRVWHTESLEDNIAVLLRGTLLYSTVCPFHTETNDIYLHAAAMTRGGSVAGDR